MAERKPSQAQHAEHTIPNPFVKMEGFVEEIERAQAETLSRCNSAVDEWARLTKETLAYQAELMAQWQKLWLGGVRRAGDMVSSVQG